jgi:hypothetical protein
MRFLSATDSDAFACRQAAIQGVILYIGYVLFGSLATKGLDQVRLFVDSKKAGLNFYDVFDHPDLVATIVS